MVQLAWKMMDTMVECDPCLPNLTQPIHVKYIYVNMYIGWEYPGRTLFACRRLHQYLDLASLSEIRLSRLLSSGWSGLDNLHEKAAKSKFSCHETSRAGKIVEVIASLIKTFDFRP